MLDTEPMDDIDWKSAIDRRAAPPSPHAERRHRQDHRPAASFEIDEEEDIWDNMPV